MFEHVFLSKPVLASFNPGNDLKDVLEEGDAGLVCNNGEDDKLSIYALEYIRNPELRSERGANSRKVMFKTLSPPRAADQMITGLERPMKKNGTPSE